MQQAFRVLVRSAAPGVAVNWLKHPQGAAWPGIVLTVVSNADGLTMQGPDGLWRGRVQVDVYALTYAQAQEISRAVIAALHGYSGGGFGLIYLLTATDGRESGESEDAGIYRVRMDFRTAWRAENAG